ncbi:4'-phosphopantetheinyl transferase superfamily protein [Streptomyces aurantiacus]|uniref:4'-phosphopantetheinyl transferase family protein n=1 Tax=Streptomyces aurantiacus TaxID=47760 RepID=UPI00068D455C
MRTAPAAAAVLPAPAALAEPLQVTPQGPWHTVRRELAERGSVVVFARLDDWLSDFPSATAAAETGTETGAGAGGGSALPALLGRDWQRFAQMTNDEVRGRFLASRLLLKYAAAAVLEARPADIDLAYKPGGRPYLRGCDQVDISLSHTADLLVVGITRRGWIGVDAELSSRQLRGSAVERQICTPYETQLLARTGQQARNAALVRLWTLKEAYSKAIGQGLRFRFTEFGFAPGARRVQVLRPDGTPGSGDEWSFCTWSVAGRYTVSLALVDLGFDDAVDVAARTMLDEALAEALLRRPHHTQWSAQPEAHDVL